MLFNPEEEEAECSFEILEYRQNTHCSNPEDGIRICSAIKI
jgi:hypothetical protein